MARPAALPLWYQRNLVWSIISVLSLSIGHSFGIIPAPGSPAHGMQTPHFAASAFPAPPNKSSERAPKISRVPPKKQPLALGAVSARSGVPQLQGQKRRNTIYQNRVHLIGYLGRNPEQKSAKQSGRKYTVFSLATKRAWKGADEEWHSKTEWHRIIAWNGLGEYAAAKLRKGDHIYIEGTLVSNIYEKKVNKGKNATSVEITFWQVKAQSIRKLNRVKGGQATESLPSDAEAGDAPF